MPTIKSQPELSLPTGFTEEILVRHFHEIRHNYQQVVDEVIFLLRQRLRDRGLEVAQVVGRVKAVESILDKVKRKEYRDPLAQITDLAGVRVVCLHPQDLEPIVTAVRQTFRVLEEVDKDSESEPDRFGYRARHFIVGLTKEASGERYRLLRKFVCEIQVRTVLQDAWAIIDHHLRYKRESQVPQGLRREIHSLAAVLETADRQFAAIAAERRRYIKWLNHPRTKLASLLDKETNQESIEAYLRKRFAAWPLSAWPGHARAAFGHFNFRRYPSIRDVHEALERTGRARERYRRDPWAAVGLAQFALAIACVDRAYAANTPLSALARRVVRDFRRSHSPRKRSHGAG